MRVSGLACEFETACCRSVVKVAIPQRRGRELPMKAIRRMGVMIAPRFLGNAEGEGPSMCLSDRPDPATGKESDPVPDRRAARSIHWLRPPRWCGLHQ